MQSAHGMGHGVSGGVGIKAAVEFVALIDERGQPAWVGPGAGGGDATEVGMEGKATDRIDGRLTEGDGLQRSSGDREVTWSYAVPGAMGGSAKLGVEGMFFFPSSGSFGLFRGVVR